MRLINQLGLILARLSDSRSIKKSYKFPFKD